MTEKAAYQRAWRQKFNGVLCICGQPASMLFCGDKVCASCHAESQQSRAHQTRKAIAGRREPKGGWPCPMYSERLEAFTPSVQFNGDRLVIDGHGHYEVML